ncbi:MAG: VCBS repeat-containing protein [Verrucomicrobia bacterium]|nr:VCBS repeat-containing protein [Verrucomicrobiota bacterium]
MKANPTRFTEHLISGDFSYVFGISAADIDGDGNIDLVAADTDVGLYWFENDGFGNFARHIIHTREHEWLERRATVDINGDGKPEIVHIDNINGGLLWFQQTGGDPRDKRNWQYHYITHHDLPGAYDVAVADFDGDGDFDVAASSWRKGNQFAWFENRDGLWVKHLIEENIGQTRTMRAADINGNGMMDLLGTAATGNEVIWYENPGDPVHEPWIKHLIDTCAGPSHGHPVDMDGDGDLDVVMAVGLWGPKPHGPNSNQIVWYENDGHPGRGLWKKHIICDSFPNAFEAIAADIDGDGHMEVVATGWGEPGRVALFKHDGDPQGHWTQQVLKDNWTNANQVIVADLTGNGLLDIIASAERGSNELRWWRNEGPA